MHHIGAGETFVTAVSKVISWGTHHDGTQLAERIRSSLAEEISALSTSQDVLAAAIHSVSDGLEQAVAPEQLFSAAITAAVHRGGNTAGTALLAGQLIGGLFGNTATGTPSHLDNYLVLEELVDRWVRLTT